VVKRLGRPARVGSRLDVPCSGALPARAGGLTVDVLEPKTAALADRNGLPKSATTHLGELVTEIQRRADSAGRLNSSMAMSSDSRGVDGRRLYGYERRKRAARKIDFEDLLELTIQMCRDRPRAVDCFRRGGHHRRRVPGRQSPQQTP
jgi:hypothetical protein